MIKQRNRNSLSVILIRLAAILIGLAASSKVDAAQIPPFFINSVVALGTNQLISPPGSAPLLQWATEGTGFFYGYLAKDDPDPTKRQYEIYLVTAKHVVVGHIANLRSDLNVRLNPKDASAGVQEFSIPNQPPAGATTWFYHPNNKIDVAAVRVNFPLLREKGFEPGWFANDQHAANIDKLKDMGVTAGDGIFVLGFPMNLAGIQKNYVIVRQGVIARMSELLDRASDTFMIDSFVFPGNSGGPVILKPEITAITGTKAQPTAYLIGLVVSYRPYSDVAISQQTGQQRVLFEENSGLAEVVPTNYIDEAIAAWRSTQAVPSSVKH